MKRCEGYKECAHWAHTKGRRSPSSAWHWYCDECARFVAKCGWELRAHPGAGQPQQETSP